MRLIDADALKEYFSYSARLCEDIDKFPTIEERKTGKWIKKDCDLLYCSECDLPSLHPWPYCERCGAKMGGEGHG